MPKGRNKSYQEPKLSKKLGGSKAAMAAGAAVMPVSPAIGSGMILGGAVSAAQEQKAKKPTKAYGVSQRMNKVYKRDNSVKEVK